jgi:putative transcriptional regulator
VFLLALREVQQFTEWLIFWPLCRPYTQTSFISELGLIIISGILYYFSKYYLYVFKTPERANPNHLMPIIINLDVMMARRKMSLNELSDRVGITLSNLSILKNGKAKAVRLETLEAICKALNCQPGDILEYAE